ncbi:protein serine phosphatase with GAF(s) sensor(s) [Kribbella flavida DSM 17836]|uniref:Protein serine phosphatase with GAF(S) sensor(S) n=1 Tax=Kribbella flavida (strain DSM 17836 / JCM 10339 / NBRC 14399) TaxID=479435 RepID=D2PWY5_KRIFD|nr:GAF domain-containing SpoIIE family protein phosphatase [Kribbella flavida]ADB35365.1 protein serine phosphatase with GAF(s) sensor(s) [Kribbella flavida DSM 17836]
MPSDDFAVHAGRRDDPPARDALLRAATWDGLLDDTPEPGTLPATGPRLRPELAEEVALAMAGSLNLRRTVLQLLTTVRPELADWAVVLLTDLRTGAIRVFGGDDVGASARVSRRTLAGTALERILHTGQSELLHVDIDTPAGDGLATLVPTDRLRQQASALHPVDILGLPLTARGTTLGALIVVRGQGRGYAEQEVVVAEQIAQRAALALDSARLYEERSRIATALQRSLVPPPLPTLPGVDLAARYRAAAEHLDVGGDFYDVYAAGDDLLVTLGDVAGKGVEAAVLTGRARQSLRTAAYFEHRPGPLLSALNAVVYEDRSDRFVTVICARVAVTPDWLDVELAVAGHTAPFVLRGDGTVSQVEADGTVAGVLPAVEYDTSTVRLRPGDSLLMFTDGVEEARGDDGFYGLDRIAALLSRYAGAGSEVICGALEQDVVEHLNGRSHDDIALLAITCPPLAEPVVAPEVTGDDASAAGERGAR